MKHYRFKKAITIISPIIAVALVIFASYQVCPCEGLPHPLGIAPIAGMIAIPVYILIGNIFWFGFMGWFPNKYETL